jgi:hypothetical protein
MKKISWLEDFAESRKQSASKQKKVTASKKATKKSVAGADMIIIAKSMLPKAVNGNTVKYQNIKWKVVDASYKDAKGSGIVMKKIAGIDTKPLTSPETRAYTDPGAVYDYNVRETTEIPDFEEAARQTEEQIAKEDAVDHDTTPAARYQNHALMGDEAPAMAPETEDVVPDAEVTEEAPADEDAPVVEEEETEEVAPVEEEAPVDEEADDFTFDDVDAEPLDETPAEEETEDTPVEEDKEEKKPVAASKKVAKRRKNPILMAMLKR